MLEEYPKIIKKVLEEKVFKTQGIKYKQCLMKWRNILDNENK